MESKVVGLLNKLLVEIAREEKGERPERRKHRPRYARATAVPEGRIGKPRLTVEHSDRGSYSSILRSPTQDAFDGALGFSLGLPPAETPPPARSKADQGRVVPGSRGSL